MNKEQEQENVGPLSAHNSGSTVRASWNFSLDNIRENIARYENEAKDVLIACFRWCIDPLHPLAKPDFAKRVKCSDNLLYKLYTGTYRNERGEQLAPSVELISQMKLFLELEKERFMAGETQFVLTPTAKKIVTACDLARESQSVVFVWGPSHVGKTWAVERHYQPNNNHGKTIYVRMHAACGLGGMVRVIADAMGISAKSNTPDLIRRIKDGLTPNTLLILDECHLLAHTYRKGSFHNCMEVIREFHDQAKCGLVLIFTILDDVKAASQKELQQLWRRGVHKVQLASMPTKGDVGAILNHNGLEFPDAKLIVSVRAGREVIDEKPYDILRQLARNEALLAITERIRYGRKLAVKAGQKLKWEHFVDAHLRIAKNAEAEGDWN